MSWLFSLLVLGAALVAIVVIGAPYVERGLMYHPWPERVAPKDAGLTGVREHVMTAQDGTRIITWHAQAQPGSPTLLYFHGNGGSLAGRADRLQLFQGQGFGFLIMAYRGYSGSQGAPSEARNVSDALKAYETLRGFGVAADDIVVYGESIGTGVAVQVAAQRPVGAVVLDAPYTSIVDVAEIAYPVLPARLLMRDRYETMEHLKSVSAPLLVIHGERDEVIPVEMGRAVAAAAPGPSKIVTFPLAGHSDHYSFGSFGTIVTWIEARRAGRAEGSSVEVGKRSA